MLPLTVLKIIFQQLNDNDKLSYLSTCKTLNQQIKKFTFEEFPIDYIYKSQQASKYQSIFKLFKKTNNNELKINNIIKYIFSIKFENINIQYEEQNQIFIDLVNKLECSTTINIQQLQIQCKTHALIQRIKPPLLLNSFPNTLKTLILGMKMDYVVKLELDFWQETIRVPPTVEILFLGSNLKYPLVKGSIPDSVTDLTILYNFMSGNESSIDSKEHWDNVHYAYIFIIYDI
ncbi:hypothetical protein DLAC_06783 [Tieghemostelium lacteum]|uniref:F-box domain-containing protein n=1 Tax=Tieghemostelium lacteum TaxID=361077 RepID=A0A151ZDD5_TIELA|nr:hypothetical protein DLAC_06783 [Tieghemostelium lacteum]|eukprot:KYQ91966.1 hypothetical protein DLAC_06783 [Tieghemostelium lacteum]